MGKAEQIAALRAFLVETARPRAPRTTRPIAVGLDTMNAILGQDADRNRLHEIMAASVADAPAGAGFALALMARLGRPGRPLIWVRHRYGALETGHVSGHGLAAAGLAPQDLLLVHARTVPDCIEVAREALKCNGVGAVLLDIWGETRALDLTASRRLALAAETSGIVCLTLRTAAAPAPSAAATRWQVRSLSATPLAANAPGRANFEVTLLKNRAGPAGQVWRLEWDHDRQRFDVPAPSGAVAALPVHRPAAPAGAGQWRDVG